MAAPRKASTEDMLALRKQGLTFKEIAEKLGVCFSTVQRRINKHPENLTKEEAQARAALKWSADRRKEEENAQEKRVGQIRALREQGFTDDEIAVKLGFKSARAVDRTVSFAAPVAPKKDTPVEPQKAPSEPLEHELAQVVEETFRTPQRGQRTLPERICDFADTPGWIKKLETLARLAQPETWRLANNDRPGLNPEVEILGSYINATFQLTTRAYNAAPETDRDKIFYIRDDVACFHTGLYTPEYKGIYALFRPNRIAVEGKKEYWLVGYFHANDAYLWRMTTLPDPWPRAALPLFDPSKRIYTYTSHMLVRRDGTSRLPDTVRNYWNAGLLLETAVELARRKAAADPVTAVACPRVGGGGYLLPLYLTNPDTPDVVAVVVTTAEGIYTSKTCLTLNQAYLHARSSGKVTADWLLTAVEHGGGEPRGVIIR